MTEPRTLSIVEFLQATNPALATQLTRERLTAAGLAVRAGRLETALIGALTELDEQGIGSPDDAWDLVGGRPQSRRT